MTGMAAQLGMLTETLGTLAAMVEPAHAATAAGEHGHVVDKVLGVSFGVPRHFALIPFIPLLSCVLCGVCAAFKVKSKLPAMITVASLAASFVLTFMLYSKVEPNLETNGHTIIHAFDWINFTYSGLGTPEAKSLVANFSFFADSVLL